VGREPKVEKAGDLVGHAPFAYKRPIYASRQKKKQENHFYATVEEDLLGN
jgi:hypothetical protein